MTITDIEQKIIDRENTIKNIELQKLVILREIMALENAQLALRALVAVNIT